MFFRTLLLLSFLIKPSLFAQHQDPEIKGDSIIYRITVDYQDLNITGKKVRGMTINQSLPAPVLHFKEGKHAVIYVTNNMDVPTSMHWHGLLLPNYMDGVAYLTTPPIMPNKTLRFDFPLIQSGTYWYHSHTGLQEQRGIYGGIIVEPKKETLEYDHDLVLVVSDWTNDNPQHVLKNLKRHNEWYGFKIGNAPSLLKAMANGTESLKAQLKLWSQKMPGMHISDIPYDAFLINGKKTREYTQFKPGSKVRLRVINAGASTYFWLHRGGGHLNLISTDGIDVQPVHTEKVLIGNAETYDFLLTMPEGKQIEFRATAQDVTGHTSAFLGSGQKTYAKDIPKPDYQELNIRMAKMHSNTGAHSDHDMYIKPEEKGEISANPGRMKSTTDHETENVDHSGHNMEHNHTKVEQSNVATKNHSDMKYHEEMIMDPTTPMIMWKTGYSNSILKAKEPTLNHNADSIRSLVFNLSGNMWRYTWSMNGKTLSESDKIEIKKGEIVRITLNNTTMMHHPMHLHGHFFRVLNGQGDYSPLKHTLDVPPMSRITIEFDANEDKDWFFHCHILYHMSSGMGRVISYKNSERDPRLEPYPIQMVFNKDKQWFNWGTVETASQYAMLSLVRTNTRNQFNLNGEFGWNQNYELTADYERFTGEYFRLFGGIRAENEQKNSINDHDVTVRTGFRYLLWYILDSEMSLDHKLRPELAFQSHIPVTQRLMFAGHGEWKSDFGIVEETHNNNTYNYEVIYTIGFEYLLTKDFALIANYDNRFGWGGGLSWIF